MMRRALGGLVVVLVMLAIGGLTRYRYRAEPERAELRLTWRTRVPRVVECRTPTAEELAELPVHMRQEEICQGRAVPYRLEVRVDGRVVRRASEQGAGARGDRPLQVFEELPLAPGRRRIRVVFERADTVGPSGEAEPADSVATSLPDRLVLDRTLDVGVRDVVLITYDRDGRRLILRDPSEE